MCPLLQPDFSETAELTPGSYKMRVTGVSIKESKRGQPYARWELEVFGNDDTRLNGRKAFYNTMLAGPGASRLKQLLTATIGPVDGAFETDHLMGKEIKVTLVEGRDQDGNKTDFPEVKAVAKL